MGTPVYLAPEVVHSGIITKSSDIYSFGALLWQVGAQRPLLRQLCCCGRWATVCTGSCSMYAITPLLMLADGDGRSTLQRHATRASAVWQAAGVQMTP